MSTLRIDIIYFPRPSLPQPAAETFAAVAPPPPSFDPVNAVAAQTQIRHSMRPGWPQSDVRQHTTPVTADWVFAPVSVATQTWMVGIHNQMQHIRSRAPHVLEDRHRAMAQLMEWSALFAYPVLPTLVVAAVTEQGSGRPWRARDPGYAMYTMAALNPATMTVLLNSYFPTYRPRRR